MKKIFSREPKVHPAKACMYSCFRKQAIAYVCLLGMFCSMVFLACQKRVQDVSVRHNREDFFRATKPVNEKTAQLIEALRKNNERTHFLDQLPENMGLPVWNKVFFNDKKSIALRTAGDDDRTLVTSIPLTKDDEYLSGVLLVETNEDEVISIKPYTSKYLYDVCHDSLSTEQARETLGLFMLMDYETFGNTKFQNIPKAMFPNINFASNSKSTTDIVLDTTNLTGDGSPRLKSTCFIIEWQVANCGTPGLVCCSGIDGCDALHPDGCPSGQCTLGSVSITICTGPTSVGDGGGGGSTGGPLNIPTTTGGGGFDDNSEPAPPCGGLWYRTKECNSTPTPRPPVPSGGTPPDYSCAYEQKANFDKTVANTTEASIDETSSYTDVAPFTKNVEKAWQCIDGADGWKLTSHETGVIKYVSLDATTKRWEWQSLVHNSITKEGSTLPGVSVSFTQGVGTPNVYSLYANMELSLTITYTPICNCPNIPLNWIFTPQSKSYTPKSPFWPAQP